MSRLFTGFVCALALSAGAARAQTGSPAPVTPPEGTLSTTRTTRAVDAYGNRSESDTTTYRNTHGVAEDSRTVTTTVPAPMTTTTTTSSSTTEQR